MMEQRDITFDLETIKQGECICMLVPYFSGVISIYPQDNKSLSRLRCTSASFISDNIFSKLCVPEMQKPDSDLLQREVDLSDLVNLKGLFYLSFLLYRSQVSFAECCVLVPQA